MYHFCMPSHLPCGACCALWVFEKCMQSIPVRWCWRTDTKVLLEGIVLWGGQVENGRLQETKLAGTGHGFGAALHAKFAVDVAIVPFDRAQSEE